MPIKIALLQLSADKDLQKNLEKTIQNIESCARQGAKIICTQELFCYPYFCEMEDPENFSLAETIPNSKTQLLSDLAEKYQIVIIASFFEKQMTGLYYNTAIIIDADGSILGKYRKTHIPDDPDYYEKYYFTPGDLGYPVWETRYGKFGVLICWDQWFPEAARCMALQGAEILFYPTAIGWQKAEEKIAWKQHQAWEMVQRGHAISNALYVCAINRVGQEKNINFWGQSFICDPMGDISYRASQEKEENIFFSLDIEQVRKTRHEWPFFRDRRVDTYQDLLKLSK